MRTFIALSCLSAALLLACSSAEKTQYLQQYSSFMQEVKSDYQDYDRKDWEQRNRQMDRFLKEDYREVKDDLSDEEKAHVISEAFSYYMYEYGEKGLQHFKEHEDLYMEMVEESADMAVEMAKIFGEDVLPELQKHMPEIRRIGEEFFRELEDKGTIDRLEDVLERFGERMEEIGEEMEDSMERNAEQLEREAEKWEREQKKKSNQWEL